MDEDNKIEVNPLPYVLIEYVVIAWIEIWVGFSKIMKELEASSLSLEVIKIPHKFNFWIEIIILPPLSLDIDPTLN